MDENKSLSKTPLNLSWLFLMAWRDSRKNRSRLFLFISSIILGIAALVAIYSFGDNLRGDIDNQAATLIGADLVLSDNKPISPQMKDLVDSLGKERSQEQSFASMVLFPKTQGTRLVQVRALEGNFPYYGSLETTPAKAGTAFRTGQNALVDRTLMLQFNARIGDSVKVGEVTFLISGILEQAPGQATITSSVAPVVYIPLKYIEQTGLLKKGSRINYKFFYKYPATVNVENLVKRLEPRFEKEDINYQTIESQKRDTGRSFEDLTRFLSLVGFIALLLGCIGVASAIHIYIREKLKTIAILRCLGVTGPQAFLIYLIQIIGVGLIGSIIGAALGTIIQQVLPIVLEDILPVKISVSISWLSVLQGVALGVIISVLFALLPLLSVRNISPLNTLRLSFEETSLFKDPLKWLVYLLIAGFIIGFSYLQLDGLVKALSFTAGVFVAFLVLAGVAWTLIWLLRRFFPSSWSYLWRQGLSNLFRPNNQTLILIVSIGLGAAFISTLFFVQGILLNSVSLSGSGNQPNMILFDIQNSQKNQITKIVKSFNLPIIQDVPIVTMRVDEINGINAAKAKMDSSTMSSRAFNSEVRATYRDTLTSTESITKGKWNGNIVKDGTVFISIEEGYANRIHVDIGDKMVFNVQGTIIPTVIGSFRKVNWNRIQTNFRVVFPKGILEDAPQFNVLVTRVPSNTVSADFQQTVVRQFPNISVIDLGLILKVIDDLLGKIGFVIQFMGAFSIITGIMVLIASVLISKYQRIQESVLLRTLGASRKQILIITGLEYFFLGALAASTGILLSLAGSWALAKYTFETSFTPQILPIVILFSAITVLTVVIGLFNSRGILNRPPLEILRQDV